MRRKGVTAKFRVALGQVGLIVSVLMLANFFGMIPDKMSAVLEGRASLAEALAINCSALVLQDDAKKLESDLDMVVGRNASLLSAAMRRVEGGFLVAIGDHADQWSEMRGEYSTDSQIQVPIWAGDEKWGQLELRFEPLVGKGIWGMLLNPHTQLVLFVGICCFVSFYFYLGFVLRHLDPSQAIPGRVRSALDTMAEGLLVLDRKEQIVLANSAFASMLDRSPDSLMGHRAGEIPWKDMDGQTVEKKNRPWVRALKDGEARTNQRLRLVLPDESHRTFMVNCSPVLGTGGKYAGVLVSFDDITQLEEKEAELRKSKEAAEAANLAKSAFLANMSHEIRTPMNAVLGFTEILKRGYGRSESESRRYLDTIHSSGRHLLDLINDILDLSKIEAGRLDLEKARVEPVGIIQEVLQVMGVKAREKGLRLDFEARTSLPRAIESDPARLRQIVFNLVGNAVKFTDQGGIVVSCELGKDMDEPRLLIRIADTGIGMERDKLGNIFDPFVQADNTVTRRYGGTGLGLSISRRFARALGGDITVESAPGEGSTFTVILPTGNLEGVELIEPAAIMAPRETVEDARAARWRFPGGRVLVVDDGAENRELVKLILEEAGLGVEEAENGEIGVEKALATTYDLILTDLQMPVMDGFTATRILREKGMTVPIIALTAHAMRGFDQECLAAGFSDYITKPIDIDHLMKVVADRLGGRLEKAAPADVVGSPGGMEIQTTRPASTESSPIVSKLPVRDERFRNLIARFVPRLFEKVRSMEEAEARGDLKAVSELAHWLKGAGGTVGFDVFTEPAKRLEEIAKAGSKSESAELIGKIRALALRLHVPDVEGQGNDANISLSRKGEEEKRDLAGPSVVGRSPDMREKPVVSRLAANPRLHPTILKFVDKMGDQMQKMEKAWENKDFNELVDLAHWLKGAGGTVGYDVFTEPAAELERSARSREVEGAGKHIERIRLLVRNIVPPGGIS